MKIMILNNIYLDTGSDEYSLYICISKSDSEDMDYIDSYDIGDEIFYSGTFYYDGDDDNSGTHYFHISDGISRVNILF